MTCKENSVGAGNRSSDTGRHNQCSASVPTCGTMRFKWDRADLVCGCPHSRSTGCGHKFGSVNPPPCGLHATAIAVARAQPARGVVGGDGNGVGCTASGQEIDELDAFLASEARPQERKDITPSTAFSPRWRSAPIFRFRADGLPVVWGSKSDPVVESAEQGAQNSKPHHAAHEHDRRHALQGAARIRADTLRRRGGRRDDSSGP